VYYFLKKNRLLPRELAFLSELRLLDLNGNELQGVIPHLMLTRLTKLEKLHLHMNDLFGNLPTEIGNLKNLKELTIFGYVFYISEFAKPFILTFIITKLQQSFHDFKQSNFFFGSIPNAIANLKKLSTFYDINGIAYASLHPCLHMSLLFSLLCYPEILDLYANNLTGSIPSDIGQMKKLRKMISFFPCIFAIIHYLRSEYCIHKFD